MPDTTGTPSEHAEAARENRARDMDRAAEKPELKLLARINMAYVTPFLLTVLVALGGLIWSDQREAIKDQGRAQEAQKTATWNMTVELNSLKGIVNGVVNIQLPGAQQFFDSRFNAQASRLDALVRSDEQQSKDIKELQIRAYSGGGRVP